MRSGVNGSNRTLWCVDFSEPPTAPRRRWSLALGNIDGSPVLWQDTIYVGTTAGVLYAVDAPAGTIKWSRSLGDGPVKGFVFVQMWSSPVRVLLSTTTNVWAIEDNVTSGDDLPGWPVAVIPGPSTPVYVPGTGKVLVGSSNGRLYQMDATTPLPATSVQLGDGTAAVGIPSVDILKSMIYVGTDEGVIYGVLFPLPP